LITNITEILNNKNYMPLTKINYSKEKDWDEKFIDKKVKLSYSSVDISWYPMFKQLFKDERIKKIEDELSQLLSATEGECLIYPKPDYIFKAFQITPLTDLKVVFIGQDPYFNNETIGEKKVPQAMGLSFSVPIGTTIPSSLNNIYNNLVKFKHIEKKPANGNLEPWAYQGCLMINTALTVEDKKPNCHAAIWKWFTDFIISYISENCNNVIFVIWGVNALEKTKLIDLDKHDAVISSHPSGMSADKPMKEFPPFNILDQFGKINKLLERQKKKKIMWNLLKL